MRNRKNLHYRLKEPILPVVYIQKNGLDHHAQWKNLHFWRFSQKTSKNRFFDDFDEKL